MEGWGKYLKAAASLRSVVPLARVFSKPLTEVSGARELALAVEQDVPIGEGKELSIAAGAGAKLGVHQSGSEIFAGTDLQAPVTIPNGTAYTSLQLEALIKASLSGTTGKIGFGFSAGTALRYAYFHPFDIVGDELTVGDALKTMLSAAVFPADAEDLTQLAVGAFVSVAGEGELTFSGEATLSSTTNLLATPGLPIIGTAALTAGASVTVGAEWTASGEFEMRVSRADASTLRVAFYRRRGRSLTVSAKASAGVTATVRGKDLLATLMRAISPDPEADLLTLVNAGLDDEAIEAIQEAVAASIDRSLTLSAQLQVSSLRDDQALFAYDVDIARLDDAGKAAMDEAMHGRLTKIGEAPAGGAIRLVSSAARQLRERKTSWRINMLGILNVASFVELVREGTVLYDPVSGALTAADKVSARRIRVKEVPLESHPEKLRKVLFESLLITAAYHASRALGTSLTLTADQTYLEQRGRTKRQDLEDHYRALIALGLCDERERDLRLGTETEFGASTFVIENSFSAAACDAMFLDADGTPHSLEHYEAIGRRSLLALIPATDPNRSYRRVALESDAMWARVRMAGAAIDTVLPGHIRDNPLRLAVVRGDVVTIVWWAKAMSRAATELVAMRTFLGQRDAASLAADPAFTKARARLSEALEKIVATTEARFDDPWDVLAMDAAAARLGRLESLIISTRFAAAYKEPRGASRAVAGSGVTRHADHAGGSRCRARLDGRRARGVRATRRQPARRKALDDRHLQLVARPGREDLQRVHPGVRREAERAAGARPVLRAWRPGRGAGGSARRARRRRFWEMNGIYPVYFVWETGLNETVRDIVGAAIPKRGERGAPTDLAIEKLARNGGKQVWSQMKKSAEKAADAGRRRAAGRGARRQAVEGDARNGRVPRARPQRRRDLPRVLPAAAGGAEACRSAAGRRADAPPPRAGHHDGSVQEAAEDPDWLGAADHQPDALHHDRRARAGRQLDPCVRQVAAVSGEQRVRRRRTDADPGSAEEPEAGPAADPLLRPRRHREGRRHRLLPDGRRGAAQRPVAVDQARRIRQRHRDDDERHPARARRLRCHAGGRLLRRERGGIRETAGGNRAAGLGRQGSTRSGGRAAKIG